MESLGPPYAQDTARPPGTWKHPPPNKWKGEERGKGGGKGQDFRPPFWRKKKKQGKDTETTPGAPKAQANLAEGTKTSPAETPVASEQSGNGKP